MKVLFIGNSHTYMNDMPRLAGEMISRVTGSTCDVVALSYSGRSLKWHMEEEYFAVRFNILHGGYDFCVMQEVAHPMTDEGDTVRNAERIIGLCRKAGTVPVIFETWAEKAKPYNQAEMTRRYRDLTQRTGALLAPIGETWERVMRDHLDIELYWKDGEHASPAGDYLAALVITRTLTGKVPGTDLNEALDFSPEEGFQPVREDPEDERITLPDGIIRAFHEALECRGG
ncbi:MAG: hypothetical protein J5744_01745 [Oscillospiraceae bacterium]|nr:hypothetical protein [Oscillospiraceae bacterium]